jgi:predicted DNA-binding transcriptional regulator AlpA
MPDPADTLLMLKQVAAQLGISERQLRRMVREGRFFQPVRSGGLPRYHQRDVDAYIWAQTRGMTLQGPPLPAPPRPPRKKDET